jgi:HAD superfamily hydrolase (TIGR01549 family)
MIRAVTFDLWNTLFANVSYSNDRLNYLIQRLKSEDIVLEKNALKREFYKNFDFTNWNRKDLARKHIHTIVRLKEMLKSLNILLKPKIINDIVESFESTMLRNKPPLKNNVRKTLDTLSPDYKIGLISDTGITPGKIIREVLEDYKLSHHFEVMLFSDETGIYKPDPSVFQLALKKLKVNPENTLHVGDLLLTDIKGANNCHITSVWINDNKQIPHPKIIPDFEIQDLYEVVNIIKMKLS